MGVGAIIPLRDDNGQPFPASQRFRSSVRIPDLERIEKTLQTLAPPQWPSEIFGEVDATLAAQGQQLFEQHCRECHGPHLASEARQKAEAPLKKSALDQWLIEVIPVEHIGTDSTAADGFLNRHYDLASTGLTRQEIAEVLHPSLRRQLARDVLYHLQSLAIEPNNSEAQKQVLISALNQYPAPDSLADANFVNSPFEHMSQQLRDAALTPQKPVKETDAPYQALQCDRECHLYALNWLLTFGRAQAEQTSQSFDPKKLTEGVALNIVGLMIKQRYFEDQQLNTEAQQCLEGFGTLDLPQQIRGYKPRPLAGVWATPPFLHNGSVPSIYQMLMPPEQRDKRFFTGPREYDPKYLGYKNESDPEHEQNGFWFDTSLQGNHNTGHGFSASTEEWQAYLSDSKNHALPPGVIGPEFTHEQRMAIIEYLKIHQDNTQAPADYSAQDSCLARAE